MFLPLIGPDGRPLPTTAAQARNAPMVPNPGGPMGGPEPFATTDDIPYSPPRQPGGAAPPGSRVLPDEPQPFANMTDIGYQPPQGLATSTPKSDLLAPAPGGPARLMAPPPNLGRMAQSEEPLEGEVLPPVSNAAEKEDKQQLDGRQLLRSMARILVMSPSPAERVQGLQMLFESTQPTPGETASAERDRVTKLVETANVDPTRREQARLMAQMGANTAQIAEILGFDSKGREEERRAKEAANAGPLAAQKSLDEAYVKEEYIPFKRSGARDMENNISVLNNARKVLATPGLTPTGPLMGQLPDMLLAQFPSGQAQITARDLITTVGQRNLKEILGAQFAQKEGEEFLKRVFNPALKPEENMQRANRLLTQIERAYADKIDMADYYEKNGTLKGFKGKLAYSLRDFENAVEGKMTEDLGRRSGFKPEDAPPRPMGSDEDILADAMNAYKQGVDPKLISARLKAWGINP